MSSSLDLRSSHPAHISRNTESLNVPCCLAVIWKEDENQPTNNPDLFECLWGLSAFRYVNIFTPYETQIRHGVCDSTTDVCLDGPELERAIERILKGGEAGLRSTS